MSNAAKAGKLAGKVVAITGATRGIGRGIAEAYLAEGAKVAISGRSEAKGRQAIEEMNAGDNAYFIAGDVTKQADVEAFIDKTVERYGTIDILVNNAGGSSGFNPVVDLSDEAWNEALNWMLNATFWGTRRALRYMIPKKWGRIINISSVEGRQANKIAVSHYITNKHAINGFTKAVAFENGPIGITCNAILAGAVETDLMMTVGPKVAETHGISYEDYKVEYAKNAAIKRLNTVGEVAAMAVLLASEEGGGITGAMLDVNGGTSI
ncbi:3-hydroxybutyrate dehydrogenase/3-oxoacyl-[acyl-carrier protein] reductase [Aromatoleum tolulyticum]|uniref:3-hydroxybutyrate dehydrogenase/3-oxoacyl-[acyl-carrier protein] reductase n=1 Tax=Aromatoleum tolulyticum TaxID=34027 RepID=A0A1N7C6S1_9RHOO|nr:SDR family NAD(P)-dependent oxidoreductase [Aromatoleum tolulyticum]SIR59299.1 3-hydroxybutyrate dehydrogenase/3-oxoacyl-[acyl-carrier protein] reductase [Aromatoleum tolulyticum]